MPTPIKPEKFTIRIESILGGHSPTTHFAAPDQFRASIGIDPSLPKNDTLQDATSVIASGLLRPSALEEIATGAALNGGTKWIIEAPKNSSGGTTTKYIYDSVGSVYTLDSLLATVTGLSDLNDGGTSTGNGAEYYDNYVYFARSTTIARYGPLDDPASVFVFTDDYWVTTLGKTALTNTSYPLSAFGAITYSNHVMHRHSDGKLYIADVVGNQGAIHVISTTKTTVEGDTDNGSTYNKLTFGYNLKPIAMESYGSDLVIALFEGTTQGTHVPAKLAFWDTTSQNFNKIIWVEFPDTYITGLKNINGVLYVASGNEFGTSGFRISRFVGGYTIEEMGFFEDGIIPLQGGMDGMVNQLLIGSISRIPDVGSSNQGVGCIFSFGLRKNKLGQGLFCTHRVTRDNHPISALKLVGDVNYAGGHIVPIAGTTNSTSSVGYVLRSARTFTAAQPSIWWSQTYRIGQPFKILSIRIPLAQPLAANMTVTPTIYFDSGAGSTALSSITSAKYGTSTQSILIKPTNLSADNDFFLELKWTGTVLCTVSLPITIEYELKDIMTAYP